MKAATTHHVVTSSRLLSDLMRSLTGVARDSNSHPGRKRSLWFSPYFSCIPGTDIIRIHNLWIPVIEGRPCRYSILTNRSSSEPLQPVIETQIDHTDESTDGKRPPGCPVPVFLGFPKRLPEAQAFRRETFRQPVDQHHQPAPLQRHSPAGSSPGRPLRRGFSRRGLSGVLPGSGHHLPVEGQSSERERTPPASQSRDPRWAVRHPGPHPGDGVRQRQFHHSNP